MLPRTSFDHCLVCGTRDITPLPRYVDHYLVRCQKCSFVFSSCNPSLEELNKVYSAYRRGDVIPTPLSLLKYRQVALLLMRLRRLKTVLDVGCGDGHLLASFKEYDINIYGTEYDDDAAKMASNKGVKILPGGLQPAAPEGVKGFDMVAFTEVIEHINNPKVIISHFYELLVPGGLLYITTPNFRSIESNLLGPDWGMIAYPEHLCYYTPETLHYLLESSGFERVLLTTENVSFFRLAQFFLKNRNPADSRLDPEIISSAAQNAFHRNTLLRMVKWLVNKMLAATGTGTNLIAIYRRPSSPAQCSF